MSKYIDIVYYLSVAIATITGIIQYKYLNIPMRIVVVLLCGTLAAEVGSLISINHEHYGCRYTIFHFYNIAGACLYTLFFIYAIKPYHHKKYVIGGAFTWVLLGILNILFLQPLTHINSNMLLAESLGIITMSLYFIYWLIKYDIVSNLFSNSHFQIVILWLVSWSSTFFFWAFMGILYNNNWPYINMVFDAQVVLNIVIYSAIGIVIYNYPKKIQHGKR